jgi:hypothetical protein
VHVLFDEQDCDALLTNLKQRLIKRVDDNRRQAERDLVADEQPG